MSGNKASVAQRTAKGIRSRQRKKTRNVCAARRGAATFSWGAWYRIRTESVQLPGASAANTGALGRWRRRRKARIRKLCSESRCLERRVMLDTNFPVTSGSCAHSLNFILNNFPIATVLPSAGGAECFLSGADSAIVRESSGAPGRLLLAPGIVRGAAKSDADHTNLHQLRHSDAGLLVQRLRISTAESRNAGRRIYAAYAGHRTPCRLLPGQSSGGGGCSFSTFSNGATREEPRNCRETQLQSRYSNQRDRAA